MENPACESVNGCLEKGRRRKKQAAKRLQEVDIDERETTGEQDVDFEQTDKDEDSVPELFTETAQFSLEPLSLEEREEETVNNIDEIIEEDETNAAEADEALEETASMSFSEDLTIENDVPDSLDRQEEFEETQKDIDLNDTAIIEGLSTENASAPFDDTFHGVVFEEEPDTDIYEETLPGVSADTLASDLGGGKFQPTPVAAKTVFTAGKPAKTKNSFKWGLFAVLALLAAGSFAVFYYFTITPVSRNLPSPMVARGIEFSGVENPPISVPPVVKQEEIQPPASDTIITEVSEERTEEVVNKEIVQQALDEEKSEKQALIAAFDNQSIESAPEMELLDEKPANVVREDVQIDNEVLDKPVSIHESENKPVEEPLATVPENKKVEPEPALLNISKSKKQNQENETLSQAYKAYQGGHFDAAKSLYESVLKTSPDNRDAHLGLGAIAINNGDRKSAYSHYVHLLELNPLDTFAMSSLIALSNSADPIKDESAIKLLIQRDDKIPSLYFMLGNLYAKQKRWTEAQQAFFDAYRLEPGNADYILNLAVSLDRMGQYDTALEYYNSAVELSRNTSVKFDYVSVNNRINTLSKRVK